MKTYTKLLVGAGLAAVAAAPAFAFEPGTLIIRGGVGTVQPKSTNYSMTEDTLYGPETVTVDVRNATNMTMTGTYMLNEHWALDMLVALPFEHDIKATLKTPNILVNGVDSSEFTTTSFKFAETKQLPPTFSVQYHFRPDRDFQPYVGLGLNWTTFSSTKLASDVDSILEDEIGMEISKIGLDDSYGVAAQIGGDFKVGERMIVNFDVRWMDIDSDVWVRGSDFEGKEKLFTAEIDPWVYALNLGYHF